MIKRAALFFVFVVALATVSPAQGARPYLLILNKADNNAAVVDPQEMKVLGTVPTGEGPHEAVILADGRTAVVANYGAQTPGSSLSVIDLETRREIRRVDISPLMRPHGIQEIGGKVYFSAETNRAIARFDPVSNRVDWLMGTGQNLSHMLVGSADQKRFFTANIGSDTVTAFEFQSVPPAPSKITHIPVGKQPEAIDLSPDGKEVWVGLNADNAIEIIDAASAKSAGRIALGGRPYRVKLSPDGKQAVATMLQSKEIVMIDTATRKETRRVKFDSAPLGVIYSKSGKWIFVTAVETDAVFKVDAATGEIAGRVVTGRVPDGSAVSF